MAHTKMFAFNLVYLMGFRALLSLLPIGQDALTSIVLMWGGITIGSFQNVGAINFSFAFADFILVIIPAIVTIVAACIIATVQVIGTSIQFNPFKLLALIFGITFCASIGGALIVLTPDVPFVIQSILIFPFVIMLLYSLVMDIGDMG